MEGKDKQAVNMKIDGIGEVEFIKSRTSRLLRISMKPFRAIRVTFPAYVSIREARQFAEEKKEWIKRQAAKMNEKEKAVTLFRPGALFKTRDHTLYLHTHEDKAIKIIIKSGGVHIFYPSFASVDDPRIQRAIRKGITEAWRIEAAKYLPRRVEELAAAHGFSYGKVSFRNNKTRWGSCSRENNISLHIQLMRLPQHLADYIILHELAHTVHKNHGKQYWQLLDKITGNARKLDKEMNGYRLEIW